MNATPDFDAAIADARRWLTTPGSYGPAFVNMARCLLADHEERERGTPAEPGDEKRLRGNDPPRVEGEAIEMRPESVEALGRTIAYGNWITFPWWVYVEPANDTYNLPTEQHRFHLGLSDDALDAAYGEDWAGKPGDDDGWTIAEMHAAAWRLNRAIVSIPPAEPEVVWTDGRAEVGAVTLDASAPDGVVPFWRFDVFIGERDDISGTNVCYLEARDTDDEATAKRLAIVVARAMQDGGT